MAAGFGASGVAFEEAGLLGWAAEVSVAALAASGVLAFSEAY